MMQYTVLFQIECLHGYFAGNPCRSLTLVPTEDCRQLLRCYHMIFRPAAGGGTVYAPKQSPPDVLKVFAETAALTFALISTDPALHYYTDVGPDKTSPTENIYHFDNSADYKDNAFGRPRQLLHPPGTPFAHATTLVRSKMSSLVPAATTQDGECKVIEPISQQVLWQSPLPEKGVPLRLDLRKLPEGIYNLNINNEEPQRFYLSDDPALRRWGVVSIYAGGTRQAEHLPENCRVIDSEGIIHPRTFTVALESRKTIWRYYIIDSADKQDFSRYELVATAKAATTQVPAGSDIPFVRLPEPEPIDGHAAWVFESKSPLPLLLSPASALSLILRPNGASQRGGKAIRLPYAQPNSLVAKEGPGPKQMCSDIFVYV